MSSVWVAGGYLAEKLLTSGTSRFAEIHLIHGILTGSSTHLGRHTGIQLVKTGCH